MSTELHNLFLVILGALGLIVSIFGSAIRRGLLSLNRRALLLGSVGVVGACLLAFGIYRIASRPTITPENVEAHLRKWAANFNLNVINDQKPSGTFFFFQVTGESGIPIIVMRPKDRDQYVVLQTLGMMSSQRREDLTRCQKNRRRHSSAI